MRSFWRNESAASAVEYAVLTALIAAVIVTAVAALGSAVLDSFQDENLTDALS